MRYDELMEKIITIEYRQGKKFIQMFNNTKDADKKSSYDAEFMKYYVFIDKGYIYDNIDIDWTRG